VRVSRTGEIKMGNKNSRPKERDIFIVKIILSSSLFFSSTVWAGTNPVTLDGPSFPALMGVGYSQNFTTLPQKQGHFNQD